MTTRTLSHYDGRAREFWVGTQGHDVALNYAALLDAITGPPPLGGVLFSSNPHGADEEGFSGERYGAFHTLETWSGYVTRAGFEPVGHYYRPAGKPRAEQPWLATVWRKAWLSRST